MEEINSSTKKESLGISNDICTPGKAYEKDKVSFLHAFVRFEQSS